MAVVEGVMGLYDGFDGLSEAGSSAQMAKWLGLPVVLVVDARSMARSAAALVHGFSTFDPQVNVIGVIFNRVSGDRHLQYLKEAMWANLPHISVFGGIPREHRIEIPERHLGLITADEATLDSAWQSKLTDLVDEYVDLDQLLDKVRLNSLGSAPDRLTELPPGPLIAIARDAAFCFYYKDNFELLRNAGARLHFFSPLAGEVFPEETAGLYLGGGYPELFAEQLAGQSDFLGDIRRSASAGMPIYAECGGLMVLSRFIETLQGERHPMAGQLPFGTRMLSRRKALGYMETVLRCSCLLGDPGLCIRGHEFHYSEILEWEDDASLTLAYELRRRRDETLRPEGYMVGSVLASYVHLHWGSCPEAAAALVKCCRDYQSRIMQQTDS
jgi:cobyrinic acid a,c-diamide synthase